jgi:branched-chain amino acid transport system permease protein
MTTIYGPVTGVFILYPLMELLRVVQEVRILLFTVVVICILLFMPEGIAVWVRDKLEEECPRCKEINMRVRKLCRVCDAPLHLDRE